MIGIKDIKKLISVVILTVCAVCVCTVFLNFRLDLLNETLIITDPQLQVLYDAQITMSNVILACTGGVLGLVTLIVLLFSIQKFITENSANMGVLKALGYSGNKIAFSFSAFGLSVLVGSVIGYFGGYLISPLIYKSLSSELVENLKFGFNIETVFVLIIIPSFIFTAISILFAMKKLKQSPLNLINKHRKERVNKIVKKLHQKNKEKSFLNEVKQTTLLNNLLLIFFVGFAAFGFSAQIQMALSMRDITPDYTMTVMLLVIGFILGTVTILLAFSFLFNANGKYLALLKAYGYTNKECANALFGSYRTVAYIGFAIGTAYQFMLVKSIVSIFAASYDIPDINFNFVGLTITLGVFALLYELLMIYYKNKVGRISLQKIMND